MEKSRIEILKERKPQITVKGSGQENIHCDKKSLAGSVSQRACVFCGSRVVLYPVADVLHLVHGPIGCAAYTWDIRGALSSGPELHRMSFSTDLKEEDVIHGGETKLYRALIELIAEYAPKAAFVYATCITGLIGDDIDAVCRKAAAAGRIPVLPVHSEGFRGTKKDGYQAACAVLMRLIGEDDATPVAANSINILGDYNLAGETWVIKEYYAKIGIEVVACFTGDGRVDEIRRAHRAALNVVQCSGSMISLAKAMQEKYGIPFIRVSYFGMEDTARALYDVARFFRSNERQAAVAAMVKEETEKLLPVLNDMRYDLEGKKAAIYVGGAFKAFSLIKALTHLGIATVVVGSQTGSRDDYAYLLSICQEGTVVVDDTNPAELASFLLEKEVDILIGGVKERPLACKLGIAFCDHNHERKICLAGFVGMLNFAKEVHASLTSPVWRYAPALKKGKGGV